MIVQTTFTCARKCDACTNKDYDGDAHIRPGDPIAIDTASFGTAPCGGRSWTMASGRWVGCRVCEHNIALGD